MTMFSSVVYARRVLKEEKEGEKKEQNGEASYTKSGTTRI